LERRDTRERERVTGRSMTIKYGPVVAAAVLTTLLLELLLSGKTFSNLQVMGCMAIGCVAAWVLSWATYEAVQ